MLHGCPCSLSRAAGTAGTASSAPPAIAKTSSQEARIEIKAISILKSSLQCVKRRCWPRSPLPPVRLNRCSGRTWLRKSGSSGTVARSMRNGFTYHPFAALVAARGRFPTASDAPLRCLLARAGWGSANASFGCETGSKLAYAGLASAMNAKGCGGLERWMKFTIAVVAGTCSRTQRARACAVPSRASNGLGMSQLHQDHDHCCVDRIVAQKCPHVPDVVTV